MTTSGVQPKPVCISTAIKGAKAEEFGRMSLPTLSLPRPMTWADRMAILRPSIPRLILNVDNLG